MLRKRGFRIRATSRYLIVLFNFCTIGGSFLATFCLIYGKSLVKGTFKGIIVTSKSFFIAPSMYVMIVCSLGLASVLIYCFRYRQVDFYRQLQHRQKIAQMVLENHWYESEMVTSESFFKDLSSHRQKEKITYFPKIYYVVKDGLIFIDVEIRMGKYQDQLLQLENRLESGLYCELVEKELKENFVEYVLFYDMIANRLSLHECQVQKGAIQLMKSVWWEYDQLPHMLIAGGTGSGKTYFILTIIELLLKNEAKLYILDPKNADLADLETILPDVYYRKGEIIDCIGLFYQRMVERSESMKHNSNYRTGKNYAYLDFQPEFLIFDEYVAFMNQLNVKETAEVLDKLKQIVMLGRQSGFFLILACQRPDAKYLGDGIRDQFNFRVAIGRMSELGYSMIYGETKKKFFLKRIKGRGYVDVGTSVISEFYTPLVPKEHDFLDEIRIIYDKREEETSEEQ